MVLRERIIVHDVRQPTGSGLSPPVSWNFLPIFTIVLAFKASGLYGSRAIRVLKL